MMNGSVRVRRDVQGLTDAAGVRILEGYSRAIGLMKDLDEEWPVNPLGRRFQAAMHGYDDVGPRDPLWDGCRHNSWFFLAWHRCYLYRFERIIQHLIADPSWSLPYWDYTKSGDSEAQKLPAPFRPGTSHAHLHTDQRDPRANDGERLWDPSPGALQPWDAATALGIHEFAKPPEDASTSFGGGIVDAAVRRPRARGALELRPHGTMHGEVGGFMSVFATAGLDPVFWLHHANIDRLWQVWIDLGGRTNPSQSAWLNTTFDLYDDDGSRKGLKISDVLETSKLGYRYESTAPPPSFVPQPQPQPQGLVMARPELVGNTQDVPFADESPVEIDLVQPLGLGPADDRWYLRVENVVGQQVNAPNYGVYVIPSSGNDRTPRQVGLIAGFGIAEASTSDADHDGTGITDVFDISDVVIELRERDAWDDTRVRVVVKPTRVRDAFGPDDVRAGSISLYRS